MSGITGVDSNYNTLSLTDLLSNTQNDNDSILSTSTTAAKGKLLQTSSQASSKRANNAYGGTISASSGIGQAALNRALSEMGGGSTRVTFSDIANYQKELESKFSKDLRLDLFEAGVSLDTEFSLNMTSEGEIQVLCNDPQAKLAIEKYLEENPEVCEDFGYIQALANLERAKQSPLGAAKLMDGVLQSKKEIQLQAVETFFDDALSSDMKYSSLMATFASADSIDDTASATSFYAGIAFTV